MQINVSFDQPTNTLPVGFVSDVQALVGYLASQFTDNITFTLHVGFGEIHGDALDPNLLGQSQTLAASYGFYTYQQIRTALINDARTADDISAVNNLPLTDPITGTHEWPVGPVEAMALGLLPATTPVDVYVGFTNRVTWDFDRSDGITLGAYDFIGSVAHETTEVMGRYIPDIPPAGHVPGYFVAELFHYSAPGVLDFARGGYASPDGGVTNLNDFNLGAGDVVDWAASVANDSFGIAEADGVYNNITFPDLRFLDILGYDRVIDDYGADTNFAGGVSVNSASTGVIQYSGDRDWFRVFLNAGTHYRFNQNGTASGQGTLSDPFLFLYNSAATLLASNDDAFGSRDSQLFYTPTRSGMYYLGAAGFSSNTGSYTVLVTTDDYAADPTTTGSMPVAGSAVGAVELAGDRDWFSVQLTAGTSYVFRESGSATGGGTLADPYLYLYDGSASLLAQDDDSGPGLDSRLIFTPGSSGTYFLGAAAAGSNTGTYTVSQAVLAVYRDFNLDGHSDLLWQNGAGDLAIWDVNGAAVIGSGGVGRPGPSWHTVATGDFNGDGFADILWQNLSGQVVVWELNGTNIIGSGSPGNPGPSWHAIGSGDFNGDNRSDILFQNSAGETVVWALDGAGVIGSAGLGNPGPSWHAVATGDFNGDGRSDVLFQNSSGEVVVWELNGGSVIGAGSPGNPGPTWHVVGSGDVNGDGRSDILWQNDSGEVAVWELNGTSLIGAGSFGNPGPSWHALGVGDYNGDGLSDIRFQNSSGEVFLLAVNGTTLIGGGSLGNPGPSWHVAGDSAPYFPGDADLRWQSDGQSVFLQNDSGEAFIWATNGAAVTGAANLGNPGPSWHVKAAGDINADGRPDLLWQNDSGEAAVWEINGASAITGASLGNPGPNWHIVGAGDLNRDGKSDLLWQNDNGEAAVWALDGTGVVGGGNIGNPGPTWHIKGSGDFNHDGFADILWQNDSGEVVIWAMNGTTVIGGGSLGNPGPDWHTKGTGDFNGDGFADILWQSDNGNVVVWALNGTNVIGSASLGNPGPSWHVMGSGDYNADGRSDILFQNSSGEVAIWSVNGSSVIGSATIANPGPTWHV